MYGFFDTLVFAIAVGVFGSTIGILVFTHNHNLPFNMTTLEVVMQGIVAIFMFLRVSLLLQKVPTVPNKL